MGKKQYSMEAKTIQFLRAKRTPCKKKKQKGKGWKKKTKKKNGTR